MAELKALIVRAEQALRPLYVHISGQAIAWLGIAQVDASKWEAAAVATATAAGTALLKRLSAWASAQVPKA